MVLTSHAEALSSTLAAANLVPGSAPLIPDDFKPTTELEIAFGEKAVSLGNLFRVSEVKSAPTVSFAKEENASDAQTYTLLLVDPDAPTPDDPKFAYWRHWVVSGLKPSDGGSEGKVLTEYLGPGPKDDSRPHRYLFLLFREPEGLALGKEDVGGEEFAQRRSFQAAAWTAKHGLTLVGVNWMLGAGDGWTKPKIAEGVLLEMGHAPGEKRPRPSSEMANRSKRALSATDGAVAEIRDAPFATTAQSSSTGPSAKTTGIVLAKGFPKEEILSTFGGKNRFNIVLAVRSGSHEATSLLGPQTGEQDNLKAPHEHATVVFDDGVPDENAHYRYGVNHARGAVVAVRPDLVVGLNIWAEKFEEIDRYSDSFWIRQAAAMQETTKGAVENVSRGVKGSGTSDNEYGMQWRRSIRSWLSGILA
ncbi:phosphatidylethanolamine-binding protein [Aspergillus heterothallicus]